MGNSQQTQQQQHDSSSPTASSPMSKKESAAKFSAQDLLTNANQITESCRRLIKEMNEIQYSTYLTFRVGNRIAQSQSIEQDLVYFASMLDLNYIRFQKSKAVISDQMIDEMIGQASALLRFTEITHLSLRSSTDLILRSAQLIEYIEIIEKQNKSMIKKLGMKKLLDQAQIDLNESSIALENYLASKLCALPQNIEFDVLTKRIKIIQTKLNYTKYERTQLSFEIPQEIN